MYERVKEVPPSEQLKSLYTLSSELKKRRAEVIRIAEDIISGKDKRKLFIVGPCSADSEDAVCDYARRLAVIAEKIKDKALVIVRAYTCKPRTRGSGYMGLLHSQYPSNSLETDLAAGLEAMRKIHIRIAEQSGLFTADEMVYPQLAEYTDDVLAYVALGARSSENLTYRFTASGLDMPIGVKNSTNGNAVDLLNGVSTVQKSNEFLLGNMQVRTSGNHAAHAVLRGGVDISGKDVANYDYDYVMRLYDMYYERGLRNPAVIIDTGHSNSGKNLQLTPRIMDEVLADAKRSAEYNNFFKGFMIESYIEDGCQPHDGGIYGMSLTDPCIGIKNTEKLLLHAAENIVI